MSKTLSLRNHRLGSPLRVVGPILAALACALLAQVSLAVDPFTVVLLPDTQHYTEMANNASNPFRVQTTWIANNMAAENIAFVTHLGDIVQNNNTVPSQWAVADTACDVLDAANVPYSVMPGNHDMIGSGPPDYTRNTTMYDSTFPVSRFEAKPWYGGHASETNQSNYSLFSAGGMDFLMLNLELMPSDATLAWANGVLDAHPNRRTIVATHKYLTEAGDRSTATVYGTFTGNNANQIFDELITNHPNVFMVVCGHESAERLRVATNASGNRVYEIMSDYQDEPNGGNGWLRTLRFQPDTNQITVGSYSPVLDQYNIGTWGGEYTLDYDMGGTTPTIPAGPAASLVAHWALDDGQTLPTTRTAVDATSPASNGTLTSNMPVPAAWINGRFGKALAFDGTNDRVTMNAPAELNLTQDLSMSFWIKPSGTGDSKYGPLVGKNKSGGATYDGYFTDIVYTASVTGALVAAGTIEFAVTEDGALTVVRSDAALSLSDDTWHHVAVTFQAGQRMAIYIDGALSGQLTAGVPETCAATTTQFTLGNLDSTTTDAYCYSGGLDDVWLFEGVLTQTQIDRLIAGTNPFVPGDANSDGLVDQQDAAILAQNWGAADASFAMGDFNDDGLVNAADASILAANWRPQAGEAEGTVPEPSLLAIVGGAIAALAARRRSGRRGTGKRPL